MSTPEKDLPPTFDFKLQNDKETVVQGYKGSDADLTSPFRGNRDNWEQQTLNRTLTGRYYVEEEIGKGGMGKVYRGFDVNLKRPVAIKTIHASMASRRSWLKRFRMEALIIATLRHPNIVQIYEVIARGRLPLIVMEYIDGTRYDDIIQDENFDRKLHLNTFVTICEAIGYAHGRGVLHRDIKPSNIMISKDGQPKIMDFGVAKILGDNGNDEMVSLQTMEGCVLGSPAFMSPEQARGNHRNLDIRSDIYSLGATFYFALTKQIPFSGTSVAEVITQVIKEDVTPPSVLTKGLAPDLEGICMKAMEKDYEKRYQTAVEFAEDLVNFRDGLPVTARRYGFKERAIRAIRRKKEMFVLSTCAVLAMFAGIFVSLTYIHGTSRLSLVQALREKVMGIAATSALLVDPKVVERIQSPADKRRLECRQLVNTLKAIKRTNERIEFVWIMRRSQKRPGYSEFVVEDSFYDSMEELDDNKNGVLESDESPVEVGEIFEKSLSFPELEIGYERPAADRSIEISDEWGVSLSGYAPIRNADGQSVAVLGVDMTSDEVNKTFRKLSRAYNSTLGLSVLISFSLFAVVVLWIVGLWETKRP